MYSSLKNDLSLRYIVIAAAMVMLTINLDFFAVLAALPAAALAIFGHYDGPPMGHQRLHARACLRAWWS